MYRLSRDSRNQQREILELQSKLDAIPKTASLELQGKCAAQAREEFILEGYKTTDQFASFSSHYNLKLNKCFVLTQNTDTKTSRGEIVTSETLVDAFEGKVFGTYIWSSRKGKKFWEVPPLQCKVTLTSGEDQVCHSSDEFDEGVKHYME